MSQAALADCLGVDQTAISRWERQRDLPSLRMQHAIRDLTRRSTADRYDQALRMRVRQGFSPATLLRRGAVFLEANLAALREAQLVLTDLRGSSIYGNFGPEVDHVTENWEKQGLFSGDLACCMSVISVEAGSPGATVHLKTLDTPHFTSDGEIWCVSELKRIGSEEYETFLEINNGCPTLAVPFDFDY